MENNQTPKTTIGGQWVCPHCGRANRYAECKCGCVYNGNFPDEPKTQDPTPGTQETKESLIRQGWNALTECSRDPAFVGILKEMFEMKERKSKDYAPGDDPYANFKMCERLGIAPWLYVYVRRQDKIARQETYIKNQSLTNESFEDALIDDMVYCALELILWRESQKEKKDV